jgi:hypothetical protein
VPHERFRYPATACRVQRSKGAISIRKNYPHRARLHILAPLRRALERRWVLSLSCGAGKLTASVPTMLALVEAIDGRGKAQALATLAQTELPCEPSKSATLR